MELIYAISEVHLVDFIVGNRVTIFWRNLSQGFMPGGPSTVHPDSENIALSNWVWS